MAWAEKRGPWFRVRYRDTAGVVHTTPDKYRTKREALDAAEEVDTDTRRGVFIDPKASRTSLEEWAAKWRAVHHVSPGTQAKYDQYLDHHILPAFGQVGLEEIRRMAVIQWAGDLRGRYAESTVRGIVTLFSLVMSAAAEEKMIASNPIQSLRLAGSRTHHRAPSLHQARHKPVPTGEQVLGIAKRAGELGGRTAYAMVVTGAFTGMRWGELTGLAKPNCRTADGYLLIDPDVGALHEVGGKMWLGPPKSKAAARRMTYLASLPNSSTWWPTAMTMSRCSAGPAGRGCGGRTSTDASGGPAATETPDETGRPSAPAWCSTGCGTSTRPSWTKPTHPPCSCTSGWATTCPGSRASTATSRPSCANA
ncbi:tyrosine-type recombinase/integrase [Actinomadura alba]|uniref:Core-binding (CB) domain-containing protein n=1 Tax=Actinomadura alba TaxID=406431 RepID=A0ABR7M3K1_9ACTN|nr:site-specific integrase [Actinomadura alba]MBC6471163.1 hypothetical protein [Actinomadura alba]